MAAWIIDPMNPTAEEIRRAAADGKKFLVTKFNADYKNGGFTRAPHFVDAETAIKKATFTFPEPLDMMEVFQGVEPDRVFPYKVEII